MDIGHDLVDRLLDRGSITSVKIEEVKVQVWVGERNGLGVPNEEVREEVFLGFSVAGQNWGDV